MKRKILALLALVAILTGSAMATTDGAAVSEPESTAIAVEETQAPAEKQMPDPAKEAGTLPSADRGEEESEAGEAASQAPAGEVSEETPEGTAEEATAEPTEQPAEEATEQPVEPEVSPDPAIVEEDPAQPGFLQKYGVALIAGAAVIGAGATALIMKGGRKNKQQAPAASKTVRTSVTTDTPVAPVAPAAPEHTIPGMDEADLTVAVRPEKMRIKAVGNVHNIGRRKAQQDAFGVSALSNKALVDRKGVLAIVADGMGGLENSGEISRAMVRGALEDFPRLPDEQRKCMLSLLASATRKADEQFAGMGRIGTTFIAVNIKDDRMDFISVGDSRIALVRGGALITLNRAHNYSAELQAAAAVGDGSVTRAEEDPRGAALTSYLGMRSLQKVDFPTQSIRLVPGDMVILMTDGVFGTMDDDAIVRALSCGAAEGAARIEEEILARRKPTQDNFTAIILEV